MDKSDKRAVKLLQWHLMIQLEEAGEEDFCSLLNQILCLFSNFGTGEDLSEYFEAIDNLVAMNEIKFVGVEAIERLTGVKDRLGATAHREQFRFDHIQGIWVWQLSERLTVVVVD